MAQPKDRRLVTEAHLEAVLGAGVPSSGSAITVVENNDGTVNLTSTATGSGAGSITDNNDGTATIVTV